ncbi:hypothetical protein CUC15_12220 [Oceanobacillus zhaokaii]|uniref:DUF3862 domain-containing protein n=1 Tax=Oceanobacillus zhaokaii TaxID=2052660 RepID=A0A345PI12_9BACI|nr:hypothetical protein [Oceanobacillus zhaokaii]AXI09642.1 hypothetical protein CUC15_12220 [Oceanobacillus zhaokaii]
MLIKLGKYSMLSIMLFITIALVGCQNLKDAVDDTNEKLEFNKNVSLENIEKIKLGDKETGDGGTTYDEMMELMGGVHPANRAEYEGNGKTIIEAEWWRDNLGNKYISVNFLNEKASGKFQEGLD